MSASNAKAGPMRLVSSGGLPSSDNDDDLLAVAVAVPETVSSQRGSNSNVAVAVAANATDHTSANSKAGEDDAGVIAAPASLITRALSDLEGGNGHPAEIPLGDDDNLTVNNSNNSKGSDANIEGGGEEVSQGNNKINNNDDEEEMDDDESEYSYEDEDDAAFSSFLVDHPSVAISSAVEATSDTVTIASGAGNAAAGSAESPARIRDEEDASGEATTTASGVASAAAAKPKWREPSRQAVSMSLRAEREKTGSKRRLAKDLYRIMNQDTHEAGFSIGPKCEDSMDHWIIKLFKFDDDSNLAKDMLVLGFDSVELEMGFPDQYPFEPPFVRVVRPRFKRQTGFVMNGALCMELLTKDGWNPVNDIESVIVSIRSLLVVGDGRLQAAVDMPESKYQTRLKANQKKSEDAADPSRKRQKKDESSTPTKNPPPANKDDDGGSYSVAEAHAAYSHLSDYHKKKGWDSSGWWARKG